MTKWTWFWILFLTFYTLLGFFNFFRGHWIPLGADMAGVIGAIANINMITKRINRID